MTPYEATQVDQERVEKAEAARIEWESLGATDAAFGDLPQFKNEAYLQGYIRKVMELPISPDGRIIHNPKLPMFVEEPDGRVAPGVDPGDCTWLYPDDEF